MKQEKRRWSIFSTLLVLIIVIICIIIATIPIWLPAFFQSKLIEKRLEKKFGGKWSIESIHLSWFDQQSLNQVTWEKSNALFVAKKISIETSLWTLWLNLNTPINFVGQYPISLSQGSITDNQTLLVSDISANIPSFDSPIEEENQVESEFFPLVQGKTHFQKSTGKILIELSKKSPHEYRLLVDSLSTRAIGRFMENPEKLEILLGPLMHINANGTIQEDNISIQYQFNSSNLLATGSGDLKNGIFSARTPLKFYTKLTEKMSNELFTTSKLRPISSDRIEMTVSPEDARLQIMPFSLPTLNAKSVKLNLGKMIFKNMATLSDILTILRLSIRLNHDIPIWFQPAELSIDQGLCHLERTDFLVDYRYQIASWGIINLRNKTLNMYLGITPYALEKALGIRKTPPNYVLPMRVDGPISDPELHKSWALRTIAKLLVLQNNPLMSVNVYPKLPTEIPPERHPYPW